MIQEKSPTVLTEVGARRLTARIRDALVVADDLLARAYQGRAWEALGYADWAAYCAGELPELAHLKLRAAARRGRVAKLRAEDATITDCAAATGASVGSIHGDVKALEGGHTRAPVSVLKEEPPVPLTEDIIEELTAWQTVLRHVRRAGDRGLSCLEFERETSRGHGAASAAFHSAERKGFIRRGGRFRGGYAVYVRTLP